MVEREKYVDESWKESAAQDKEKLNQTFKKDQPKADVKPPDPQEPKESEPQPGASEESEEQPGQGISFLNHVATLSYQAMIFMGEIPNPMTNQPEQNLDQAKFMIDTLTMLREKTQGNLSEKETEILNTNLYQLQMRYVEHTQKEEQDGQS